MRATKGLTLLEVIVSIGLLGVVLFALVGLQVSSLRAGNTGRGIQTLTREAENFLEALRRNPGQVTSLCAASGSTTGGTVTLGGKAGRCTYETCALETDGTLICGSGGSLYRVTLRVPADRPQVTLRTVIAP
ncbi:MAG: prepilin [Thermus sp.]|uniref:type IV pilus modification PilV family protein n=1 Tax=Thermus sp. TaxID=275 RepID=UPI00351AF5EE